MLVPLCRALVPSSSVPVKATAAAAAAGHLAAVAERLWSSKCAQTSYSTLSHTWFPPQVQGAQPRTSSPQQLGPCSTNRSLQFSTAASAAMQQQQQQPFQGSSSPSSTFEQGGADQGELIVEESAFKRLQHLSHLQGGKPVLLRVEVEGGGCSGFQYKFALVDSINPDDRVFGSGDCKVLCDTLSLEFLRGAKVEFEDSLMRSAFVINSNPNADKSTSCGCGSSFSVK
uniref:Core domain-containing protein n=1 Tax=Dunaliella tertiolecta TaxID=3047 RepID=A0A7S3QSH0_DUNTE|mmetsp:Transcript_17184/g.44998  ORF Transcript_17184/g.44998 Transcript_17184/m.44998 type:complete len:228 (-) Transcript_17184:514-1197(-)